MEAEDWSAPEEGPVTPKAESFDDVGAAALGADVPFVCEVPVGLLLSVWLGATDRAGDFSISIFLLVEGEPGTFPEPRGY